MQKRKWLSLFFSYAEKVKVSKIFTRKKVCYDFDAVLLRQRLASDLWRAYKISYISKYLRAKIYKYSKKKNLYFLIYKWALNTQCKNRPKKTYVSKPPSNKYKLHNQYYYSFVGYIVCSQKVLVFNTSKKVTAAAFKMRYSHESLTKRRYAFFYLVFFSQQQHPKWVKFYSDGHLLSSILCFHVF